MSLQSKMISVRGRIEKIFSNKVVLGVMAAMLLTGAVFGVVKLVQASTSGGDTVYIESHDSFSYGQQSSGAPYETTFFTVTEDGGTSHEAVCIQPLLATPNGTATVGIVSDAEMALQMKRVLLVSNRAYDATIFDAFLDDNANFWTKLAKNDSDLYSYNDENIYAYTLGHILLGRIYTGQYDFIPYASAMNTALSTINSWFESKYESDYLDDYDLRIAKLGGSDSNYQAVTWLEVPQFKIRVVKQDKNSGEKVDGAKFTLYRRGSSNTDQAEIIAENIQTGTANGGAAVGYSKYFKVTKNSERYCAVETGAPEGYQVNSTPKCSNVLNTYSKNTLNLVIADAQEEVVSGRIIVEKVDSETSDGSAQGEAKLAGAKFTITNNASGEVVDTLEAFDDGSGHYYAESWDLEAGTYTVKEVSTGKGYKVNSSWSKTCTIANDGDVCDYTGANAVKNDVIKGGFKIKKVDSATGAAMAGVEFKLYKRGSSTPLNISIVTGSDGTYTLPSSSYLPYGRYVLKEQSNSANAGYVLANDITFWIGRNASNTPEDNYVIELDDIENTPNEDPKFSTVLNEGHTVSITTSTTIEDVLTWDSDSFLIPARYYRLTATLYGIPAGGSVSDKQQLGQKRATFLGSNAGTRRVAQFENVNTTDFAGGKLFITTVLEAKIGSTYSALVTDNANADVTSETVTVEDPDYGISTKACRIGTSGTNCKQDVGVGVTGVADTVSLTGLIPGKSYIVQGKAVCHAHGATSGTTMNLFVSGVELNEAEIMSEVITPSGSTASTTMEFNFDSASCGAGKEVAIVNELYEATNGQPTGSAIASHNANLSDTAENVSILTPTVTTTATSGGTKIVPLSTTAKVQDTIQYTGLVAQTQYCLKGELMSGTTKVDEQTKTFNATGETGSENMEFTFDSNTYEGKDLVVNEYLYRGTCNGGTKIAEHKNGTGQTVTVAEKVPTIGTQAAKQGANTNILEPATGQVIVDTVKYYNLKVGQKYTLFGELMKSATTKLSTSAVRLEFTPETRDGEIQMVFPAIDASGLAGQTIVVYERLYLGSVTSETGATPVATHEDFSDGSQAVVVRPKVGTKVAEKNTGLAKAGIGNAVIVDTIRYEGLIMGQKYTAKGWLVNANGQKIEGSEGTTEFTIGEGDTPNTSGEVKVSLPLRTVGLGGKKVVAFEEVYLGTELVAQHKDLNDTEQTLDVEDPSLGTVATDKTDGDHELMPSKEAVVVDTVTYKGLVIGSKYCVKGVLMNKETGQAVTVEGASGVSNIEAETCFTADRTEGEVKMEFKFDASNYGGKVFVVFETLYLVEGEGSQKTETEIGKHHNINDTEQTVTVKPNTPETGRNTKDNSGATKVLVGGFGAIVLALGGYAIYLKKNKKSVKL